MTDGSDILSGRIKIWLGSKPWFWNLRAKLKSVGFAIERGAYIGASSASKAKANANILGAFAWVGLKKLFWVTILIAALTIGEDYVSGNYDWLTPPKADDEAFNIEQLRLYAQLLTAIFSIYFAAIGIIMSAGYNQIRRDIVQMLTNEQVGSVYSQFVVLAAMFCLAATALPLFGYQPGVFILNFGTLLTLLSALVD